MEVIFEDKDLEELIITGKNRKYKNIARDKKLLKELLEVYNLFVWLSSIDKIKEYSFLHYEKLKHEYSGKSCVRPFGNKRVERLIFTENDNKIEITILELDNTHYGNKK